VVGVTDTVQPGTEVDAALWKQFRDEVERRRGGTRGHLRTELENAIRGYIHGGDATPADIDDRLQRIEAAVGAAPTDGGSPTLPERKDTHTREPTPTERPPSNTATEKKVTWLAECVLDREVPQTRDLMTVPRATLREVVKDEYGFRSDTAKRYVERLVDHFGLVDHPTADAILVTPEKRDELIEQRRKELEDETDTL
jgi:hypothetical protein